MINLYTPIKGTWERLNPNELDSSAIKNIEDFARKTDCNFPKNLDDINVSDDPIEWAEKIGPMKDRGDPSGLVIKNGYIIAEWGDPGRVGRPDHSSGNRTRREREYRVLRVWYRLRVRAHDSHPGRWCRYWPLRPSTS